MINLIEEHGNFSLIGSSSAQIPLILCGGSVTAVFQPIESMRTGEIVGFEALARIAVDNGLLGPAAFLPNLTQDELKALFSEMLGQAIVLLRTLPPSTSSRYISVNVDVSLVLSEEFLDLLVLALNRHSYENDGTLVLELLEGHEITDRPRMRERLDHIRALGIAIASRRYWERLLVAHPSARSPDRHHETRSSLCPWIG